MFTNFQSDFLNYFVRDEELIYHESEEYCISKIDYYLFHEAECRQIAVNALGQME